MSIKALFFAFIGLFLSTGITGYFMMQDMSKIKADRAQETTQTPVDDSTTGLGTDANNSTGVTPGVDEAADSGDYYNDESIAGEQTTPDYNEYGAATDYPDSTTGTGYPETTTDPAYPTTGG